MALLAPKRSLIIGGVLAAVLVLYVLGSAKQPSEGSSPTANTTQCRVSVTADVLNIRSTPARDGPVVGKLSRGQESDADKVVQNGFRKLAENRWVSIDFAKPLAGRDCG